MSDCSALNRDFEIDGWKVGSGSTSPDPATGDEVCSFGIADSIFVGRDYYAVAPVCSFEQVVSLLSGDDPADTIVSAKLFYTAEWGDFGQPPRGTTASISLGVEEPVVITVVHHSYDPGELEMDVTGSFSSDATSVVLEAFTNIGANTDMGSGQGVIWTGLRLNICRDPDAVEIEEPEEEEPEDEEPEDENLGEYVSTVFLLARDECRLCNTAIAI
jgi:hypothetical protein